MKRLVAIVGGIACVIAGLAGSIYAVRTSWAQILYFQSKYGSLKDDTRALVAASERAHDLYGINYRLCESTAESVFYATDLEAWTDAQRRSVTAYWTDTGLALNTRARVLNALQTFLLVPESPRKALAHWQDYTAWHFWDAYNQALMVDLLARNGRYSEATATLKLTEGTPHHKRARAAIQAAWQRERQAF